MIESIQLLRKTGTFDNVSSGAQLPLGPLALIYAENARGKTTLSSILRSLGDGDPQHIAERKRLGSNDPPHIVIVVNGSTAVFQNGAWNTPRAEVFVFDDHFVAENVHSGMEVEADHRQNLHELIIGAQGIALNAALQAHVACVEEHNRALQTKAAAIPASMRSTFDIDVFCALERRDDIDDALQGAERNLAAGRDADAIRQEKEFTPLALPAFDLAKIDRLLDRSLPDLEADAAARVQTHLARLKSGGEAWVAQGVTLIEPASKGESREVCPFCAQDLQGSALIAHYRAYFSDAYEALKHAIHSEADALATAHTGDVVAAFERAVGAAKQRQQFWNRFTPVPAVDLDTATISVSWKKAYEAVAAQLRQKQSSPLEKLSLNNAAKAAVAEFETRREFIARLSSALMATNEAIALVKERAQAASVPALQSDLTRLQVLKTRFDPATAALCDDYLAEKAAKAVTEGKRDAAREALNEYRNVVFPAYETAINNYLQRLNAGFRLGSVTSTNIRTGSTCNYNVLVNDVAVPLTANAGEPSNAERWRPQRARARFFLRLCRQISQQERPHGRHRRR